jgi:spore coat polysaccharide biosynthesis protein SpsF
VILAVVQARLSSSRLPGKVLIDLYGKPMLVQLVNRVKRSQLIDKVVVATSIESFDDAIYQTCIMNGIDCFRGSHNDVLDRYYYCAELYSADKIVRITADCPLTCPEEIDRIITELQKIESEWGTRYDYINNADLALSNTPDGLDVELITFGALDKCWRESNEREHTTKYIWENKDQFFILKRPIQYPELYNANLSVDTKEDYYRIEKIFRTLYERNENFGIKEIADYLNENIKP